MTQRGYKKKSKEASGVRNKVYNGALFHFYLLTNPLAHLLPTTSRYYDYSIPRLLDTTTTTSATATTTTTSATATTTTNTTTMTGTKAIAKRIAKAVKKQPMLLHPQATSPDSASLIRPRSGPLAGIRQIHQHPVPGDIRRPVRSKPGACALLEKRHTNLAVTFLYAEPPLVN